MPTGLASAYSQMFLIHKIYLPFPFLAPESMLSHHKQLFSSLHKHIWHQELESLHTSPSSSFITGLKGSHGITDIPCFWSNPLLIHHICLEEMAEDFPGTRAAQWESLLFNALSSPLCFGGEWNPLRRPVDTLADKLGKLPDINTKTSGRCQKMSALGIMCPNLPDLLLPLLWTRQVAKQEMTHAEASALCNLLRGCCEPAARLLLPVYAFLQTEHRAASVCVQMISEKQSKAIIPWIKRACICFIMV